MYYLYPYNIMVFKSFYNHKLKVIVLIMEIDYFYMSQPLTENVSFILYYFVFKFWFIYEKEVHTESAGRRQIEQNFVNSIVNVEITNLFHRKSQKIIRCYSDYAPTCLIICLHYFATYA